MTVSLDPKSARRIVTGLLHNECKRIDEAAIELDEHNRKIRESKRHPSNRKSYKLSVLKTGIEDQFKRFFGNSILCGVWSGRVFYSYVCDPIPPTDDNPRPYHSVLLVHFFNTRSKNQDYIPLLDITTHAMERILSRKQDTALMDNLREEFPLNVIQNYIQQYNKWSRGEIDNTEVKFETTNGIAVILFKGGNELPILATWYPKD